MRIKKDKEAAKRAAAKTKNAKSNDAVRLDKSLSSVDTSIFQHFKDLTHLEEEQRTFAAFQLIQQLSKTKDADKRQKELAYTLKRLIRGCGASTNVSRAGFFTGLVGLLKTFNKDEVSIEQIFSILQKELHVGATIANKEDADAVVGKILICGAVLHAGRLINCNNKHLEQITNILLLSTRHRTYHSSLGFSFLIELLQSLPQHQFESSIWPLLRKELTRPWPKQTLQTVYCLIAAQNKFPSIINVKFLKAHFGGPELLNAQSYQTLYKLYWEHSNTHILTHPAFELFGTHIASCSTLAEFWKLTVDLALKTPTKLLEIETLKIATDILNHLSSEKTNVVDLLSTNFMYMFIEGLKNLKQKNDETLKAFYTEFLEALVSCCAKLSDDVQRVAVIRRLLLPPGAFNIEKYTSTRIVHQLINGLGEIGVMDIFELYKSIFQATLTKNPQNSDENWLNFERLNAGYMLQHLLAHKSVQSAYSWRDEQLRFLLTHAIFNVTESGVLGKKENASSFNIEFGEQCQKMFFIGLQSKFTDLQQEKQLLLSLVRFCQEKIQQKHSGKHFRLKHFDNIALQNSWKSMFETVTAFSEVNSSKKKKEKTAKLAVSSNDKLQLVFHILLLNMGLQLFREPEMASSSIDDLLKCMQRTKQPQKSKNHIKSFKETEEEDGEPDWIEVMLDLFLHLLSHNASSLRYVVNALFPHLCASLNLNAVHQILSMLDMKDGQNPLRDEDDDSDGDNDDDDNDNNNDDNNDDDNDDDNEQSNDLDSDSENDSDSGVDNVEEITATDKLRNALSQALIVSGASNNVDDDMASIDLNDITEEEGRKLDNALASAFRTMKKTSGSGSQIKKSKSYRVNTTTVMHFRIRVLDLIEIYLQQKPTLLIAIEIMLALFNMLEFCVGEELRPLQIKVEKVLNKLTSFKTYYMVDDDLKEDNLVHFIRLIFEKKAVVSVFDMTNKLRNKCIVFLIGKSSKIAENSTATRVLALCQEYLTEFIKSRNPIINITLISDIFKQSWSGVWDLANVLAQGITAQTRTFRRIQIYEILSVLYKNNELLKLNMETTKKYLKNIEKSLHAHINMLACDSTTTKHSSKEFQILLELLLNAKKASARLSLHSCLSAEDTNEAVQAIRRRVRMESLQVYQRYCVAFKLSVIRNNEVNQSMLEIGEDEEVVNFDSLLPDVVKISLQSNKRKQSAKDLRQQKKQKKQQRMQAASQGISGNFNYAQNNGIVAVTSDSDSA